MLLDSCNLTLFHASYTAVEVVSLDRCRKRNDFGRGFYLTTSKEQAERFIRTAVLKSGKTLGAGVINKYSFPSFGQLQCHEFASADKGWLHCVCENRRRSPVGRSTLIWDSYDVLAGKIANDDTLTAISIYLSGGYGEYGSEEAVQAAIRVLKPERLKDQICLKSEEALAPLVFLDAYEVPV
jgi:hypothetical protein